MSHVEPFFLIVQIWPFNCYCLDSLYCKVSDYVMLTEKPQDCDVVIIGAGMAGLTAAALLVRAGLRVTVVESDAGIGGYLAGFTRKGFTFDSSVHWLNQCAPGGFVHKILSMVDTSVPVCKSMEHIRRYKGESFDYLLTNQPDEFRDALIQDFSKDRDGIRRMFEDAREMGKSLRAFNSLLRSPRTMSLGHKISRQMAMARWSLPLVKHVRASAEDGLRRYVKGAGLRKVFCTDERFMSIITPLAWSYDNDYQVPPEGGCQTIVDWLRDYIVAGGSHVVTGSAVRSIIVESGVAGGVELVDGSAIRSNHVISTCDVHSLYGSMLPQDRHGKRMMRLLENADIYESGLTVFLGLDCDPRSLGLGEELIFMTRDGLACEDHHTGNPKSCAVTVVAPSVRTAGLAPEGKGTITLLSAVDINYGDRWKTGEGMSRGEEYRTFKDEYANILIDRVAESLVPSIREHIEVRNVATPVTYWRYTGNTGGSLMGTKPTGKNIRSGVSRHKTHIRNLYVAGHWSEYGGGVPIAARSALTSSMLVLRNASRAAFDSLCRDVDGR